MKTIRCGERSKSLPRDFKMLLNKLKAYKKKLVRIRTNQIQGSPHPCALRVPMPTSHELVSSNTGGLQMGYTMTTTP
jgi:hypothetical protein